MVIILQFRLNKKLGLNKILYDVSLDKVSRINQKHNLHK